MKRLCSLLIAVSLVVAGCGDDDEASDGSFAVGEDDLCEWLTEEQVTQAAREGYAAIGVDWDGEASLDADIPDDDVACHWALGEEQGEIQAYFDTIENWDLNWDDIEIVAHEEWLATIDTSDELTEHDDLTATIGTTGIEYPELDDGVVAMPRPYAQVAFGTTESDDVLVVGAYLQGMSISVDVYENAFPVATVLLDALDWPAQG